MTQTNFYCTISRYGNGFFCTKPVDLLDTVFNLYGFLPVDADPRWPFLNRYYNVRRGVGFKAINFANAWGATYLSATPSFRSGFVCSINPENCLQLNRALDNLEQIPAVRRKYEASAIDFQEFDMQLARTDRLTTDPRDHKRAVTPCPEALYQIRLRYRNEYLARVGFNLHQEENTVENTVLSIVNIQGRPNRQKVNAEFENEFGIGPFNALVKRALALTGSEQPEYTPRGLINPSRGNSRLYYGVLSAEDISLYHASRAGMAKTEFK